MFTSSSVFSTNSSLLKKASLNNIMAFPKPSSSLGRFSFKEKALNLKYDFNYINKIGGLIPSCDKTALLKLDSNLVKANGSLSFADHVSEQC